MIDTRANCLLCNGFLDGAWLIDCQTEIAVFHIQTSIVPPFPPLYVGILPHTAKVQVDKALRATQNSNRVKYKRDKRRKSPPPFLPAPLRGTLDGGEQRPGHVGQC